MSHSNPPKYQIFSKFFGIFYSPLQLGRNFHFLTKREPSTAHNSVNSKNRLSIKRNFFLSYAQIYPNITFSPNFPELFISLPKLVKIFIFLQKPKLQRPIAVSVLKMNHEWRGTYFFVAPKSTHVSYFPLNFRNFLFFSLT